MRQTLLTEKKFVLVRLPRIQRRIPNACGRCEIITTQDHSERCKGWALEGRYSPDVEESSPSQAPEEGAVELAFYLLATLALSHILLKPDLALEFS
ncbi:MAG: hypothetical protein LAO30_21505 [Acidobacteriia bacterium]|nr:hypothetical protein [Terriglobia bacterium]